MQKVPKVAVTVGDSLMNDDMTMAMLLGGTDIFRIQQVKYSHAESVNYARRIREIAKQHGKEVEILFDFSGEREHIGTIEKPFRPVAGDIVRFVRAESGAGKDNIPLPILNEDWAMLKVDERIYVADGAIQTRIRDMGEDSLSAVVEVATDDFKSDQDVNFPDSDIHVNPISDREKTDFPKIAKLGFIDWVSISFVETLHALTEARVRVGDKVKIMAKIETERGVQNIAKIVEFADGIMVARGDLAIQAPMERLGIYERKLVKAAQKAGKHVMLATQFLESMVTNPIPLRAELSDVATAAALGADSILLTKEISGPNGMRALAIAKGTLQYTSEHLHEVE